MAKRIWGRKSQEQPMEQAQPQSELEARAQQEMAMYQQHQMKKEMQAKAKPAIGTEEIRRASEILRKYKEGKARLEQKIIANEQFWKLRQWNYMNDGKDDFKPATAWLWSCIQSRYSDAMDGYPTCNFRPRFEDDKAEAKRLSNIVPVIFEQNRYEDTYSDIIWYFLKQGGCIHGVFWDASKHNGLGDISIKKVDIINFFWEAGITDLQESRNVFHTTLVANELLEQQYPQCKGKLGGNKNVTLAKYLYDDQVDTSDKSVVIDWYYKKYVNGKQTLQFVKYVNDVVLYATENETERPTQEQIDPETQIPVVMETGPSMAERGLYDHGMYPFVTMSLYPVEGSIFGQGLTDIARDTQMQIDLLNKAIIDNAIAGAKPRYFSKINGGINEEEFNDLSRSIIHVEGNIQDSMGAVEHKPLDAIYVNVYQQKVDEMKFITSNQDVNNGATPSGVTSGSAISALQESSGKNARSSNKTIYRGFRGVSYFVVELIRQFYDTPRTFRIMGEGMQEEFIQYDNSGLMPQQQFNQLGEAMGLRVPEFDIEITSEKANPYKKMEINELALSFYNMGFFNPQMTDQALACLNMMDFTKKEEVMQKIQTNGTLQELLLLYQQMALEFAQQIDPALGEQVAMQINQQYGGGMASPQLGGGTVNLDEDKSEHPFNTKARSQARESTQVD